MNVNAVGALIDTLTPETAVRVWAQLPRNERRMIEYISSLDDDAIDTIPLRKKRRMMGKMIEACEHIAALSQGAN